MSEREELWLPVVGYEDRYEVSSRGRVRALFLMRQSKTVPRLLRQQRIKGYPSVTLYAPGKRKKRKVVHLMVLEAFVGPRPEPHLHGAHDDGMPANNNLENLFWRTPTENAQDRIRHGNQARGEEINTARVDPYIVHILRMGWFDPTKLAHVLGVHPETLKTARNGKSWAHLPMPKPIAPRPKPRLLKNLPLDEMNAILADRRPPRKIAAEHGISATSVRRLKSDPYAHQIVNPPDVGGLEEDY